MSVWDLIARAELMPAASLEPPSAASEAARLSQPVTAVMWSPVPSTAPDTDLRRVAALLLHTGLPGVPVAADDGEVLGFVSRTDLLRALTTDHTLAQYFRDHDSPVTARMEHLVTTSVRTVEPGRVGTAKVAEPMSLLLTSDGVHKSLGDSMMSQVLRYSGNAAAALVEAATAAGTSDNATALVVHCAERPTVTLPDRAPDLSTAALPIAA